MHLRGAILSVLLALAFCAEAFPYDGKEAPLQHCESLMAGQNYAAVIEYCDRFLNSPAAELTLTGRTKLAEYRVLCAALLGRADIDALVDEFVRAYPWSGRIPTIIFRQGAYYFSKGDYAKACGILSGINSKDLPLDCRNEMLFELAFSNMRVGNDEEALAHFSRLADKPLAPQRSAAAYYAGYILYKSADFAGCAGMMEKVQDNELYSPHALFFLMESRFMLKDYAYVVEHSADVEKMAQEYRHKAARFVSSSYMERNEPAPAQKWMEKYRARGESFSRRDDYYAGIISYSAGDYPSAIKCFQNVASDSDSLGHSAWVYIGNAYLNLKNKQAAHEAFGKAAEIGIDPNLKKESYFLWAKLSFDLYRDISKFEEFIKLYPDWQEADEIYSYMASSCLLNKQYRTAIINLNKISHLTPEQARNLQKAAYLRGMQLYSRGNYSGAVSNFRICVRYTRMDVPLGLDSHYWMAESFYRIERYDDAKKLLESAFANKTFASMDVYADARALYDRCIEAGRPLQDEAGEAEDELADPAYSKAEQLYVSGDWRACITSFKKYLSSQADRPNAATARYYMAESYRNLGEMESALDLYRKVMDGSEGDLLELAALNYARTAYSMERYEDAVEGYEILAQNSLIGNNRREGQRGLMLSYYRLGLFEKSLDNAKALDETLLSNLYAAKCLLRMGRSAEAEPYLRELAREADTEEGAEARFLQIKDAYEKGEFDRMRTLAYDFADTQTPHHKWVAQSFMLLGDSQAESGDTESALAIWQGILDRYGPTSKDDIVEQLKLRISEAK